MEDIEDKMKLSGWKAGNPMFDAMVKMGFNLTSEKNWDGVEIHLRIFGHLPDKDGCAMWSCDQLEMKGREAMGNFIEKLVFTAVSPPNSK